MMTHIFIISFFVYAIHYCFQEGEIFGIFQKINLYRMADPFRDCQVCMVPYYGSFVYWIFIHGSFGNYILTIIPAMGLNVIINRLSPDKETPGLHEQLGDIDDHLAQINTTLDCRIREFKIDNGNKTIHHRNTGKKV